jgi:hypothetical protein
MKLSCRNSASPWVEGRREIYLKFYGGTRSTPSQTPRPVAVPVPIASIAIRMCPERPPTIEERITDNRAQTVADSVMYREALVSAAEARGWSVHSYNPERVFRDAAEGLGCADINVFLHTMGQSIGTPWQAKHKLAAAAALAATWTRPIAR